MSRHHPDLVMCRKQAGIAIGRLCDKCDGKCPVCDSYVRPTTLVRICDECSFGNYQNKCVVCGGEGISDAFYCFECTRLEKDRDGCPKIINLGSSRTDLYVFLLAFSSVPPGPPFFGLGEAVAEMIMANTSYSIGSTRKRILGIINTGLRGSWRWRWFVIMVWEFLQNGIQKNCICGVPEVRLMDSKFGMEMR
ncbi:hypothetical protein PVAG01_09382 [Phlyctema vagabunda]|uniref:PHF5-like protein n=1 Tax=Phlyctema vagabunda TaxID=108571 RepID=A0ABR4P779_9HELO